MKYNLLGKLEDIFRKSEFPQKEGYSYLSRWNENEKDVFRMKIIKKDSVGNSVNKDCILFTVIIDEKKSPKVAYAMTSKGKLLFKKNFKKE